MFRQTFDGQDFFTGGFGSRVGASQHRLTIHQDGAGAAFGFIAADFGAGQVQTLAQQINQHFTGLWVERERVAINDKLHGVPYKFS